MFTVHYTIQDGSQAIHIAAGAGHLHLVKELIEEHGVSPDVSNQVCRLYSLNFKRVYTLRIVPLHRQDTSLSI